MKSVGDFYVNIIPKLDEIALNTGITAANSSLEMFKKGYDLGKGFFNMAKDAAKATAEMVYFADSLKIPIERVQILHNLFKSVGLSTEEANATMESLTDTWRAMTAWGDANWEKLSRNGLLGVRSGDIIKDLTKINELVHKMGGGQARESIAALELPQALSRLINLEPKKFKKYLSEASKIGILSDSSARGAVDFEHQLNKMELITNKFFTELAVKALPSITNLIEKLNKLIQDKEFITAANNLATAMISFVNSVAKVGELGTRASGSLLTTKVHSTSFGNIVATGLALNKWLYDLKKEDIDKLKDKAVQVFIEVSDDLKATIQETSGAMIVNDKQLSNRNKTVNNNGKIIK